MYRIWASVEEAKSNDAIAELRYDGSIHARHTSFRPTSGFQPRRLMIALAAAGCKRLLAGPPWQLAESSRAPARLFAPPPAL
jgi:hypothetical protein